MQVDDILNSTPGALKRYLKGRGLDAGTVDSLVQICGDYKVLLGVGAVRPPRPGPMRVRFQPEGDLDMIIATVTLPTAPDPATLDPDKVPVSQQFSATVDGGQVFAKEYDMTVATADPFTVDYDKDVALSLTYTDKDGKVSAPKTQTFHSPAKAAPVVNLPPDAPGDFGAINLADDGK